MPLWIRARVFWSATIQGWAWSVAVVADAERRGAHLLLEWWESDECFTGLSPADVAARAGALGRRYAGRVAAYEIGNEPDRLCSRDRAERYAAVYSAAAEAIWGADPTAEVVPGGLALDPEPDWAWLDAFLGAAEPRVIAVHHYPYWRDLDEKVTAVRQRWAGPIWLTETGERSNDGQTEASQASHLRDLLGDCRDQALPLCVVYRAADAAGDTYQWGLYDQRGKPKPAAGVYEQMAQ
jgi:hypothetical protein